MWTWMWMDDVNELEKNADLEVEEDEANEEVSQQDEEAQSIDDAANTSSPRNHPEMPYLQKEMTKRRDKWRELASRKRSYEAVNATKRRKADEEGVWR